MIDSTLSRFQWYRRMNGGVWYYVAYRSDRGLVHWDWVRESRIAHIPRGFTFEVEGWG